MLSNQTTILYYRPQRSCGQGNVFTGVCLSTGGRGCLPQCMLGCHIPPDLADTPPGTWQTPPGPGRHHPPRMLTPTYGPRAAGTHPTGMHSCSLLISLFKRVRISKTYGNHRFPVKGKLTTGHWKHLHLR